MESIENWRKFSIKMEIQGKLLLSFNLFQITIVNFDNLMQIDLYKENSK